MEKLIIDGKKKSTAATAKRLRDFCKGSYINGNNLTVQVSSSLCEAEISSVGLRQVGTLSLICSEYRTLSALYFPGQQQHPQTLPSQSSNPLTSYFCPFLVLQGCDSKIKSSTWFEVHLWSRPIAVAPATTLSAE